MKAGDAGYNCVLFDLDGTLTDPGEGITNSVAYALRKFGIEVPERKALYKFIGPPLQDSFREYYGMNDEDCERAVAYYREYFAATGIFENEVYAGVPEMLAALKARGIMTVLATSKPEQFAVRILEHFGLDRFFDLAAGATFDSSRSKKGDVIAYALKRISASAGEPVRAIMVGDRRHDIAGARENGLNSIGVLYGYGDEAELKEAGAVYIAATPEDVLSII